MTRIVLAMSGGVDSSVAAYLLQQQGYEVMGVFMRHGEQSPVGQCEADSVLPVGGASGTGGRRDHKQGCCSVQDAEDARRVADRLAIPFYALNLQAEFARIIDYFVEEYTTGRTPNPCVMCNNWLKFGKLFDYADSVGAEYRRHRPLRPASSRPRHPGSPAAGRSRRVEGPVLRAVRNRP